MPEDHTFDRIRALFDVELVADARVVIAGCGSGGSHVALQLAMSGVHKFILIDHDVLGPENVIRHACGRKYVGTRKVDALAGVLADRNPRVEVEKVYADLMTLSGLEETIRQSELVILATDNEPSRYLINETCVRTGTPFVVGRVFTRGIGGEVFAYRPASGGCLACLESVLQRTTLREGTKEIDLISEQERDKIYGMDVWEIKDSPGLAVDIAFVASFHSRFALDSLATRLQQRPDYFMPIHENYLIWGNRPVHPFDRHFQIQRLLLHPQSSCAVCSARRTSHV